MENNLKQELTLLSRAIAKVHKGLLHFQKEIYEEEKGKKLTVHEFLHLTMTDSDFEWLKLLSTLIVQIDEAVDDDDSKLPELKKEVLVELRTLFVDPSQNLDFKARIIQALGKDSTIWLDISELRKQL